MSPDIITNAQFTKAIGSALKRLTIFPAPELVLKILSSVTTLTDIINFVQSLQSFGRLHKLGGDYHQILFGEMADSVLLSSIKTSPDKLIEAG